MFSIKDLEIERTLGEGGFARVLLVKTNENATDKPVYMALKMVKRSIIYETQNGENLKREMSIYEALQGCKFFPNLYSTFVFDDRFCMLMEWCAGGELFTWIRKSNGFNLSQIRFYSAEILLALKVLHSKKIIYRDLKSENIMLTKSGHVNIVDFGLAIRADHAYAAVGTTECMAPEVIRSEKYGVEADYWAFGILLYEMVFMRTPFGNVKMDVDIISENICNKEIFISKYLDKDYGDLLSKLLAKDKTKRIGHRGIDEIMNHPFYKSVNWSDMEQFKVLPPINPGLNFEGDARNFGYYKESITSFQSKAHTKDQ